jgi:hypothetical protein
MYCRLSGNTTSSSTLQFAKLFVSGISAVPSLNTNFRSVALLPKALIVTDFAVLGDLCSKRLVYPIFG